MTNSVRVGLAQVTSEPYAVERNRELAKQAAIEAFDAGADIVVLPEMIVHGYVADWRRLAPLAAGAGADVRRMARSRPRGRRLHRWRPL